MIQCILRTDISLIIYVVKSSQSSNFDFDPLMKFTNFHLKNYKNRNLKSKYFREYYLIQGLSLIFSILQTLPNIILLQIEDENEV